MAIIRHAWARVLRLSQTKRNLFANLIGNGWAALIQLLVIPVYIHLLGEEAYGLYAFYLTIVGLIQIFDFGFSPTINRELARHRASSERLLETRTLTRTMEVIYISLGALLGLSFAFLSPYLAKNWLQTTLDFNFVQTSLWAIAVIIIVQWPLTFYQGGVNGLQKQTQLAAVQILNSILKHGGGVIILLIRPNILLLFIWLAVATTIQTLLTMYLLWKYLPASAIKPAVHINALKSVRHFIIGSALTAFASVPLTLATPILLSRSVSLTEFGFYSLATTFGSVIAMAYMPIFTTIYPRLTSLIERDESGAALKFFHFSGQFMALVVIPLGFAMAVYGKDLLYIWQRDLARANAIAPVAALFVIVNMLAALQHLPYAWQLAYGVTKINLAITVVLGVVQLPLLYILVHLTGIIGAAITSLLVYAAMLLLSVIFANQKVKWFGATKWLINCLIKPGLTTAAIFAIFIWLPPNADMGTLSTALKFITALGIAIVGAAFSMSLIRMWLIAKIQAIRA